MDGHVAHVAHRIWPCQLDRLVEEAIARHLPEEAERRRRAAADGRLFDVARDPSLAGDRAGLGRARLADARDPQEPISGRQALPRGIREALERGERKVARLTDK